MANRKTLETDADGGWRGSSYDPGGRLTYASDSRPAHVSNSYDVADRLTKEAFSDSRTHSYAYDDAGRRTWMTDDSGTSTYSYTDRNELHTLTESGGKTATSLYDPAGRRTNLVAYGEGTFTYAYDNAGRQTVTHITNAHMEAFNETAKEAEGHWLNKWIANSIRLVEGGHAPTISWKYNLGQKKASYKTQLHHAGYSRINQVGGIISEHASRNQTFIELPVDHFSERSLDGFRLPTLSPELSRVLI